MEKSEIESLARTVMHDELLSMVTEMSKQTQALVQELTELSRESREMYDRHILYMEKCRDESQRNVHELVQALKGLTDLSEKRREDTQVLIQGYRDELQSAKNLYNRTVEAYQRLAERQGSAGSSTVSIKH